MTHSILAVIAAATAWAVLSLGSFLMLHDAAKKVNDDSAHARKWKRRVHVATLLFLVSFIGGLELLRYSNDRYRNSDAYIESEAISRLENETVTASDRKIRDHIDALQEREARIQTRMNSLKNRQ
jgi:hypothetical protein